LIDIKKEKESNKTIDTQIKKDQKKEATTIRILVLGTGDSGKSTFIKQMMVSHIEKNPFLPQQIASFKKSLRTNAMDSFGVLCKHFLKEKENVKGPLGEQMKKLQALCNSAEKDQNLTPGVATELATLWKKPEVAGIYHNRGDIQIHTSTPYYLENVERFAQETFNPTTTDIIYCREPTTGVHETTIEAEGLSIKFIDVGGQKSERRKWLSMFNGATMVIYVCALDAYTRVLEEDGKTNRLKDSIACLKDISSNKHLKSIPFQLFLNKEDIYTDVWNKKKISEVFPECKAKTKEEGIEWIGKEFEKNFQGQKFLKPLPTNVLDPDNAKKVWLVCRDIIMGSAIQKTGSNLGPGNGDEDLI